MVQDLLKDPRSGKIKEAETLVEEIINSIHNSKGIVSGLFTIQKYDFYTYTHCVNAAVFSLGVAKEIGSFNDEEMYSLGIGSMLHDIGKSKIPISVLNKPSRLTDTEFILMKQHVLLGRKILSERKDLPKTSIYPVLEHHETMNGKGYPNGISGKDIHPFGRIASVTDVYDALTTARPYKKAFSSFEAMEIIAKQIDAFDKEIVSNFIIMLGNINYPTTSKQNTL
ncbi:metal dependent phosphohydrolase [Candidatus Magnetoovum chiemensis]|nr:metal dependent phosphohydrolase [Candidatus Magnetoovum chiemensis]